MSLCWATNPTNPVFGRGSRGWARGRVLHMPAPARFPLQAKAKKGQRFTFCGMRVERLAEDCEAISRSTCSNCTALSKRFESLNAEVANATP